MALERERERWLALRDALNGLEDRPDATLGECLVLMRRLAAEGDQEMHAMADDLLVVCLAIAARGHSDVDEIIGRYRALPKWFE